MYARYYRWRFLYYEGYLLRTLHSYDYVGILSNYNGSFKLAQNELHDKGTKAISSLIGKCRKWDLPIDIQIELFNSLVKSIVLYGVEVWGSQNTYLCDQLLLRFLQMILGLRKNTPTVKVRGETGCIPASVDAKFRVLCYWYKLVNISDNSRICKVIYDLMLKMYVDGSLRHHWIGFIKTPLDNLGLSFIVSQDNVSMRLD